jgi:hypothetical protein
VGWIPDKARVGRGGVRIEKALPAAACGDTDVTLDSTTSETAASPSLVMIAELSDQQRVTIDLVHQALLVIDASRPVSGKGMLQCLGLAGSFERGAGRFLDQSVHSLE